MDATICWRTTMAGVAQRGTSMKRGALLTAGLSIALNGCAIVPDLEPEESFGYSEIVTQLQCVFYLASEKLRNEINRDPSAVNPFEPSDWVATIALEPDTQSDVGVNFNAIIQNKLTNTFTKASAGGGPASAAGVELNGDAAAQNQYNLSLVDLYLTQEGIEQFNRTISQQPDKNVYPRVVHKGGSHAII
jgi:hypothetical protein